MKPSRDLLESLLSRLDERSQSEKVFTKLYHDEARAAAAASDARRKGGTVLGPLDGTIVTVKDLFDVVGEPTTAGSRLLQAGAAAQRDALVVTRLRRAGAIILGKTNMTEFAFSSVGLNPHYGTPGNAVDASLIPGGSSSGAGVSVAEGTSEISIGTDTGGSVRIPAALNGTVGFKPTARRIPRAGAFPLSDTLDSIGPLARSVLDCALADAIMAGEEPATIVPLSLLNVRIGVPKGLLFEDMQREVSQAFDRALRSMELVGASVKDILVDDLLEELNRGTACASIGAIEGAAVHAGWLNSDRAGVVDPRVSEPLTLASNVNPQTYLLTLQRRQSLVKAMDERLQAIDVLMVPTLPICAPTLSSVSQDARVYDRVETLLQRNPRIANQFDLCATSLPLPVVGRPVGLMVLARGNRDKRLLQISAGIERLLGR
ncbi:amidase [Ensifer sp. YR511]|uniref:amidase n=1 Tax=Ensifer sp. YR511 TaxID=1855294 RepID=UPI00089126DF|nr:amidase [Ensifer sp. YR511]SDN43105.1 aspartyl-tRNA(Asn)/glutamyl-tRNA(Gln) amidotransferase subunit A [Ensifer sp. YR511]